MQIIDNATQDSLADKISNDKQQTFSVTLEAGYYFKTDTFIFSILEICPRVA